MPKIISCIQGDEIWAEERRGRATASNFSKILTPKKCEFSKSGALTYACKLLAERIVPPHYWIASNDYKSGPMANGSHTEREARDYAAFQYGWDINEVGLIVSDDDFFACSPDGLIGDDDGSEFKCPLHETQIKYLLNPELLINEYRAQCHGGMIVSKRKRWHLMSYAVGLAPVLHTFTVDDYTLQLAEALEKFRAMYHKLAEQLAQYGDPVAEIRTPVESPF